MNIESVSKKQKGNAVLHGVMPRMIVFYINYPKGVGVVEKKRMPITHPDLENEIYVYDNILPNTDDYKPYWEYEA